MTTAELNYLEQLNKVNNELFELYNKCLPLYTFLGILLKPNRFSFFRENPTYEEERIFRGMSEEEYFSYKIKMTAKELTEVSKAMYEILDTKEYEGKLEEGLQESSVFKGFIKYINSFVVDEDDESDQTKSLIHKASKQHSLLSRLHLNIYLINDIGRATYDYFTIPSVRDMNCIAEKLISEGHSDSSVRYGMSIQFYDASRILDVERLVTDAKD